MGTTGDTLKRHWEILSRIPRAPREISTPALSAALDRVGYRVTARTVQRNLEALSATFPLISGRRGQTNYWSWTTTAPALTAPTLDPVSALAVGLARDYLRALLPPATLKLLEPFFRSAADALARDYALGYARIEGRLRVLARGPELQPARVHPAVQEAVYQGLLEQKQVEITYRPREAPAPSTYPLSPLGLISREGVLYVVGTLWDYQDPRHFALHRIRHAQVLGTPARSPAGFDLDAYIKQEAAFGYPTGPQTRMIRLNALFDAGAAFHLGEGERRLSKHQKYTPQPDGRVLIVFVKLTWPHLKGI